MTQSAPDNAVHIERRPGFRGGRARIRDTRITVYDVVVMHRHLGQSLEEIAGRYDLLPAAVHAAMAYYLDHNAEIDRLIADDEATRRRAEAGEPVAPCRRGVSDTR